MYMVLCTCSQFDVRQTHGPILYRAGFLTQSAVTATASSEPILKGAHLIAIFKRKMAVFSRNH